MARPFMILSLSGGGYCGLYTARVLELIEEKRGGAPLSTSVDLIAGTSVGGILALGLAHSIPATTLKAALLDNGPEIFKDSGGLARRKFRNGLAFLRQLAFSKYPNQPLETAIDAMIPGKLFKETDAPCVVSSVCATNGKPHVFRNYDDRDSLLSSKQVAMATSAAPTYFPPYWISGQKYIDGGIIANNPDYIAVSDALGIFRQEVSHLIVVSIGALNYDMGSASAKRGFNGLLPSILSIRSAISFTMEVQQELSKMLTESILRENYYRITSVPNDKKKRAVGLDRATQVATDTLLGMANDEFKTASEKRAVRILCNGDLNRPLRWNNGVIVPGF